MGQLVSDETMGLKPRPDMGVLRSFLVGTFIGVVALAEANKVLACPAAEEREVVITADEVHHGLTFPRGSKLIYRKGFVRGCRSSDGFCLSQIDLARDTALCGPQVPRLARVYVNYSRRTFEHYRTVTSPEEGPGVFLTVVGLPAQRFAGLRVRKFIEIRCDATTPTPSIRTATVDEPMRVHGIDVPVGSTLTWYGPGEGGQVATVGIAGPMKLRDLSLPTKAYLDFSPGGDLIQIRSYQYNSVGVGPYACATGYSEGPEFHANGQLARCQLANMTTIAEHEVERGTVVRFRFDGSVLGIDRP